MNRVKRRGSLKSSDLPHLSLTTTAEPVRSGRASSTYPVLVLPPYESIGDIKNAHPGMAIREPTDRHQNPIPGVLEVVKGKKKIARYRHHPRFGWLEEIKIIWTVESDYPSALSAGTISNIKQQGRLNISAAMRFGLGLVAYVLGNTAPHIRADLLDTVMAILEQGDNQYIQIENGQIVLRI